MAKMSAIISGEKKAPNAGDVIAEGIITGPWFRHVDIYVSVGPRLEAVDFNNFEILLGEEGRYKGNIITQWNGGNSTCFGKITVEFDEYTKISVKAKKQGSTDAVYSATIVGNYRSTLWNDALIYRISQCITDPLVTDPTQVFQTKNKNY